MTNYRSMQLHSIALGNPRGNPPKQDTLTVTISYRKGQGYYLRAQVSRDSERSRTFSIFAGISLSAEIKKASRFSAPQLRSLAKEHADSAPVLDMIAKAKSELSRRLEAGEAY